MSGFYEKMKEVWRSIKTTLRIVDKNEKDAHEDLCDRLRSGRPIEMSELAWIEGLCKRIAEPGCEQRIEEGFEKLKRMMEWRIAKEVGMTRKRGLEEVGSEHGGMNDEKIKKHRRSGYQKKGQLKKENDVSWGVLPKKYRGEGRTSAETIERAISYDAEENLFLSLGEVSTSEEKDYFGEENVRKLCQSGVHSREIGCNFGGEYNCRSCVEYEIRKEYERKENERKEYEEEENRMRRKVAKEKWEAKVPKRCFYFEKEFGIDRGVMRYTTDDKFEVEDLDSEDRDKLERILSQVRRGKLFDMNEGASMGLNVNEADNEGASGYGYEGFTEDRRAGNVCSRMESGVMNEKAGESLVDHESTAVDKVMENESDAVNKMEEWVSEESRIGKASSDTKIGMEEKDKQEPKRFGFWNVMNNDAGNGARCTVFGNGTTLKKNGVDGINGEGMKGMESNDRSGLNEGMVELKGTGEPLLLMNEEDLGNPFVGEMKMDNQKEFEADGDLNGGGEVHQGSMDELSMSGMNSGLVSLKRKLGSAEKGHERNGSKQEEAPFVFGGMIADRQMPMFGFRNDDKEKEVPMSFSVNGFGEQAVPEYVGYGGPAVFGSGKSLFGGLFSGGEGGQQPAKPSIGYTDNQPAGEEQPKKNMFGVGILNAMEEDPFERSIWKK